MTTPETTPTVQLPPGPPVSRSPPLIVPIVLTALVLFFCCLGPRFLYH